MRKQSFYLQTSQRMDFYSERSQQRVLLGVDDYLFCVVRVFVGLLVERVFCWFVGGESFCYWIFGYLSHGFGFSIIGKKLKRGGNHTKKKEKKIMTSKKRGKGCCVGFACA